MKNAATDAKTMMSTSTQTATSTVLRAAIPLREETRLLVVIRHRSRRQRATRLQTSLRVPTIRMTIIVMTIQTVHATAMVHQIQAHSLLPVGLPRLPVIAATATRVHLPQAVPAVVAPHLRAVPAAAPLHLVRLVLQAARILRHRHPQHTIRAAVDTKVAQEDTGHPFRGFVT